jgi:hypothetical protein
VFEAVEIQDTIFNAELTAELRAQPTIPHEPPRGLFQNPGQARYFLLLVAILQGSELQAASSLASPAPGHGPGSRVGTPALQTRDYPIRYDGRGSIAGKWL